MLNNYFRVNNLFSLKKINTLNRIKNNKNEVLYLYLNRILYNKSINNFYNFLKILKKSKIEIKEKIFNDLLKTLILFFKRKKNIKIFNNNKLNIFF
jgi:chemotaxis methyl-accepting protein methylase